MSEIDQPIPEAYAEPDVPVPLDATTPFSRLLTGLAIFGLCVGGTTAITIPTHHTFALLLVGSIALGLRVALTERYVVDRERGHLLFERRIFFFKQIYSRCPLSELKSVALSCTPFVGQVEKDSRKSWSYRVVLLARQQDVIPLADFQPIYAVARDHGQRVARNIELPYTEGSREMALRYADGHPSFVELGWMERLSLFGYGAAAVALTAALYFIP